MRAVFDVIVIGAGMAGASSAAFLSAHRRVALLEAEEVAGYHTTGRSAALWTANYGPPDVRLLTRLSRGFFETPPDGFATVPLMRQRTVLLLLAKAEQLPELDQTLAERAPASAASPRPRPPRCCRALRDGWPAGAARGGRRVRHGCRRHPPGLPAPAQRELERCARPAPSRRPHHAPRRHLACRDRCGAVFRADVVVNAAGCLGR